MKISLGYCGPTDCCLVLHRGNESKQYGIESVAWRLLGLYWSVQTQSGKIPNKLGEWIWNNQDEDIIS